MLLGTFGIFEYWQQGSEIYRVAADNRGYLLNGVPANARWECSADRWESYRKLLASEEARRAA